MISITATSPEGLKLAEVPAESHISVLYGADTDSQATCSPRNAL